MMMNTIVDFIDKYGKTKTGKLIRKINRGKKKGWFKVLSHENGKEKEFTVQRIKE